MHPCIIGNTLEFNFFIRQLDPHAVSYCELSFTDTTLTYTNSPKKIISALMENVDV